VRARISFAVLAVAMAAPFAGCQESGFDESKETVRPLKVQHVLGETKVPGQARRPLTLTLDSLDDTLSLHVRPARAAVPGARLPDYLRARGRGVALMRPVMAADRGAVGGVEAVEAVHPDLIIGSSGTDGRSGQGALYARLSGIAPTVMTALGGGQWKLNVRLAGEALGRTNDAERLLSDYDHEAEVTRKAIRAARGARRPRVAVGLVTRDGSRFAKRNSFAGTILADAGVKQVHTAANADVTLLAGDPRAGARVPGHPVRVDRALWWGPGGALAARAALTDLARALGG
jgi:iron complex transport system substrate-binding protein